MLYRSTNCLCRAGTPWLSLDVPRPFPRQRLLIHHVVRYIVRLLTHEKWAVNAMTSPAKIAHVTTVHPWYDLRIFHKMCVSLARSGYEVYLIAPAERDFSFNGVQIHSLGQCGGRLRRVFIDPWRACRVVLRLRPDLVHMHDPELLPLALILQGLGYKVIFDAHEDSPQDILMKTWLPSPLRQPLSVCVALLERIAGRFLSGIVSATSTVALAFGTNHAVVVHNYPILDEFTPVASPPFLQRPPAFAYVGGITRDSRRRRHGAGDAAAS